jgi:hypothetical protein
MESTTIVNLSRFAGEVAAQRPVREIGSAQSIAMLRGDPITLTASRLDYLVKRPMGMPFPHSAVGMPLPHSGRG